MAQKKKVERVRIVARNDAPAPRQKHPRIRLVEKGEKPKREPKKPKQLTDLGLKKRAEKQKAVWDIVQKGLYALKSPGGTVSFRVLYHMDGKPHTMSIGRLGENTTNEDGEDWSVRSAREKARQIRAMAAEGIDPKTAKQVSERSKKQNALTVQQAIDRFIEERCKPRKRSWDQTLGNLQRACKDWLDKPIVAIARDDCREVVRAYIKDGKQYAARQYLADIKSCWKWLAQQEIIPDDTMHEVAFDFDLSKRERFYSDGELEAIWRAAQKLTDPERVYVHLLVVLAPRKTALALARWGHFNSDLSVWTVPNELVKARKTVTKRVYVVALPEYAQKILGDLKRTGDKDRIFPGFRMNYSAGNRPSFDSDTLKARLIRNGAPKDFGFHTFRHTISTWLETRGYDEYDRGLVLNHASSGVTAGYSHGHATERKRAVYDAWAKHVASII